MHGPFDIGITRTHKIRDIVHADVTGIMGATAVYEDFVESWVLSPAEKLLVEREVNTDHGVSALALTLAFFEPHGYYIRGEGMGKSDASKDTFRSGLERFYHFADFTPGKDAPESDILYKQLRCGLFHELEVRREFMIAVDAPTSVLFRRCPAPVLNHVWLVNPLALLQKLRLYVRDYIKDVRENPNGDVARCFEAAYNYYILGPAKAFARDLGH